MIRLALLVLLALTAPASAHPGHGAADTLAGFLHPLSGVDHIAAMLTVGAWSALMGGRRLWVWPVTFLIAMAAGALLAQAQLTIPLVEHGIATSLIVVGLLVAVAVETPVAVGAALIAAFALFHGYAHGTEAAGLGLAPFMAGFGIATLALHLAGIGLARGLMAFFDTLPVRVLGAATAVVGATLLFQAAKS